MLVRLEAEWPAAHELLDGHRAVGLRQSLRHDEGDDGADLAERLRHQGKWRLEAPTHGAIVRSGNLVHNVEQRIAEGITRSPTLQARDDITAAHRLAVVEFQPFAKGHDPDLAAVLDNMAGHHLRLRLQIFVDAVECIEDQEAVIAIDEAGGDHRIEDGCIGLRHEAQGPRGLRPRDPRQAERGADGRAKTGAQAGTKQVSTAHPDSPCDRGG